MPIQGLVTGGWLAVFAAGADGSLGYMRQTALMDCELLHWRLLEQDGTSIVRTTELVGAALDSRPHRLVEHPSAGVP